MCGIIGFVGSDNALENIISGLRKIEYRGYDSAGVAVVENDGDVMLRKAKGGVDSLEEKLDKTPIINCLGIGHTRWATHGEPSERNAHPHTSDNFIVVHNGIIENYETIKKTLEHEGVTDFESDTDTEVLAKLIERNYKLMGDTTKAISVSLKEVRGTFGLAILNKQEPETLYLAKRSSPIVIGQLDDAYFACSDQTALPKETHSVTYLGDDQMAIVSKDNLQIITLDHKPIDPNSVDFEAVGDAGDKGDYEHFMIKEIFEQPESVGNTLRGRIDEEHVTSMLGGLSMTPAKAQAIDQIVSVACGTAHFSSILASYMYEDIVDIPIVPEVASEFLYRKLYYKPGETLGVAITQSGETADTLAAVEKLQKMEIPVHGVVNAVGSTIARTTDSGTYLHCGPEISVASTKAFTSMVVAQVLLAIKLNHLRSGTVDNNQDVIDELRVLPENLQKAIEMAHEPAKKAALVASKYEKVMFLGRHSLYPIALEGALKFKETSYIPAEGHAAGEMKHGPLALIDKDMLSIYLVRDDEMYEKSISNLREIEARGGPTIVVTDSEELHAKHEGSILVPSIGKVLTPLSFNIALQLLAYYTARELGLPIDKPRNLAKSVTVE